MEKMAPAAHRMAKSLGDPLVIGANAGPVCLTDPVFEVACAAFISDCHNAKVGLAVEITEREPLTPSLLPAIGLLRAIGIKIVLDDFGMGYATADILPWLLPDIVKLNRSLTMLAGGGDSGGQLTDTLETLNYHGMTILAEGGGNAQGIRLVVRTRAPTFSGVPVRPTGFAEKLSKSIRTSVFISHMAK